MKMQDVIAKLREACVHVCCLTHSFEDIMDGYRFCAGVDNSDSKKRRQ